MTAHFQAAQAAVYIVDDDAGVRDALAWLLRSRRLSSETFDCAEAFDAHVSQHFEVREPSCVLLDVRMGALSGLAMFEKLIGYGLLPILPVIFLTGHADVPTAVDAVKRGAFDFCEKPFSDNALVDRIEQALALSAAGLAERNQATGLRARLGGRRIAGPLAFVGPTSLEGGQLGDLGLRFLHVVLAEMQLPQRVQLGHPRGFHGFRDRQQVHVGRRASVL